MKTAKRALHLLLALALLLPAGCLSVRSLTDFDGASGQRAFGGVRTGFEWFGHPDMTGPAALFVVIDFPFSLVADTVALPVIPILQRWRS